MTKQEFRGLFQASLESAARDAERHLRRPVSRNLKVLLYGAGYRGDLLDPRAAADALYLGSDTFYRIIDLGVVDVDDDRTIIFVRPSGHTPGSWGDTWNTPPGSGPFKQLGPAARIELTQPGTK
jgi:hypothetical protein